MFYFNARQKIVEISFICPYQGVQITDGSKHCSHCAWMLSLSSGPCVTMRDTRDNADKRGPDKCSLQQINWTSPGFYNSRMFWSLPCNLQCTNNSKRVNVFQGKERETISIFGDLTFDLMMSYACFTQRNSSYCQVQGPDQVQLNSYIPHNPPKLHK